MNHIIRHQSVSPKNQIQRALTLPDSTFAQDEDPYPINVHEHTVQAAGGGQLLFQKFGGPIDEVKRTEIGPEERDPLLIGFP
jgi:hypothetical protein